MAKLRRRGTNRWEVVVELPREDGRRRQLSRTFHGSKRDAADFGARLTLEAAQGRHDTRRRATTLGELLERWYEVASPNWSPATARQTRSIIDAHLAGIGAVPLRRLRTLAVDELYAGLRRKGLQAATIRRIHGVLHRALVQGERWDLIDHNPASRATLPKVREAERVPPEPVELVKLIIAAEERGGPWLDLAVFIRLAAVTGARRGELCGLRWSDVGAESITFARTVVDAGGGVVVKEPKTGRRRKVAVGAATLAMLVEHHARCVRREEGGGEVSDYLFSSPRRPGEPWRPDNATHRFNRLRDALGLSLRFHDVRHGVATQLAAAGIDVRSIAGRLGWEDGGRQFFARYGHLLAVTDQRSAAVLEALLD